MGRKSLALVAFNRFMKEDDAGAEATPYFINIVKLDLDDESDLEIWRDIMNNRTRYKIIDTPKYSVSSINNKATALITYRDYEHPSLTTQK